jgi:hypothetical protein
MGYKLTWMYIWQQKIRPKWWWQPWANTIAYYKFDNNLDDSSGNGYTATGAGTYSYSLLTGSDYYFSGSSWEAETPIQQDSIFNSAFTLSCWLRKDSAATLQRLFYNDARIEWLDIQYEFYNDFSGLQWYMGYKNSNQRLAFQMSDPWQGVWKHIVFTWDGVNQVKAYLNGVELQPYSSYNPTFWYDIPSWENLTILSKSNNTQMSVDEVIVEDICWTATNVLNYFNQTKSNYWIS